MYKIKKLESENHALVTKLFLKLENLIIIIKENKYWKRLEKYSLKVEGIKRNYNKFYIPLILLLKHPIQHHIY